MKLLRSLAPPLFLVACATAPASPPFDYLRGCWIERRAEDVTVTQRWFKQANGDWRGDQLTYFPQGAPAPRTDLLKRDGAGWQYCPDASAQPHGPPCRIVSDTVLEPGNDYRATIDASPERLRIAFVEDGEDNVLFAGARDGCD